MTQTRLIFCFLVATLTTNFLWAGIPPKPSPQRLVNDYVGLLTNDQANELERTLVDFDNATSIQIAVVIVSSTDGDPASSYATEIGEAWGVGQKGLDNGVVFLIAVKDRKTYIATGYGVEGYLPDATASRICQEVVRPYFKKEQYWSGVKAGATEMTDILGQIPWEEREAQRKALERQQEIRSQQFFENFLLTILLLGMATLAVILYLRARKRRQKLEKNEEVLSDLRDSFKKESEGKVDLDNSWPLWAQDIWRQEDQTYTSLQQSFTSLLKEAEEKVADLQHEDTTPLQRVLRELEATDARMEKVKSDVNLYKERAPQTAQELSNFIKKLESLISTSKKVGHTTDRWEKKLQQVRKELVDLEVANEEKYRETYLRSYDLKQVLDSVNESIGLEEAARNEVTKLKTELDHTLSTISSKKAAYGGYLSDILNNYSGETVNGLVTVGELAEMLKKASAFISSGDQMAASQEDRKYRLATEEMEKAKRVTEKALRTITLMEDIFRNGEKNLSKFPSSHDEVKLLVQTALSDIKDSDVSKNTQEIAREAMRDLSRSKASIAHDKPDFVKAYRELEKAKDGAKSAILKAKRDKLKAEAKRAEELAAKRRRERKRRRNSDNDFTHSYSSSSSSSSYSSDSGSSFGGFGGGDFGGGGGGGDW